MAPIMARSMSTPAQPRERPPNRAAERLTGRSYLSHSQISLMRSCPRRFAFQYVDRVPADFVPSSLIFGGSIHSALELAKRWLVCRGRWGFRSTCISRC